MPESYQHILYQRLTSLVPTDMLVTLVSVCWLASAYAGISLWCSLLVSNIRDAGNSLVSALSYIRYAGNQQTDSLLVNRELPAVGYILDHAG